MPDMQRNDIVRVDLNRPILRTNAGEVLAMGDNGGNRFGADLCRNGVPVQLTGYQATGLFVRADGKTVALSGTISGTVAYVDLSAACYAVEGAFSLALKLTGTDFACTLRVIDGYMRRIATSTYVADTETVVPGFVTVDQAVTAGSENPVSGGAVKTYVDTALAAIADFDSVEV